MTGSKLEKLFELVSYVTHYHHRRRSLIRAMAHA
jgi:hypothetical protein